MVVSLLLPTAQATMQATIQATDQATDQVPRKLLRMHLASYPPCIPQVDSVEGQVLGLGQRLTRLNQTTPSAQGEYAGGRVNE